LANENPQRGFRFLEYIGDEYIEAYGSSLEEAYSNAALAMFETMTDTSKVEPKVEETIEVEDHDLKSLLYSWLEALLVRNGTENKLYSKFIVEKITCDKDSYKLKAKVFGEYFDQNKHPSKTEVKAVTYHLMEIERSATGYRIRFLLDL